MSWHDRNGRTAARRLLPLLALVPALFLAGCIHPLYGPSTDGDPVAEKLKLIEVEPINGALGHYIGDELVFGFNGTGSHVSPRYKLVVTPNEGVSTPLVDTVTGLVTAATVTVSAKYVMTDMSNGQEVAHGTVFTAASYDRTSDRFSDMQASRDAEKRNARELADQIRTQIAAALSV
jgi:LPS-assembly lipoprotein